ncbi:hypothetical protein WR25_01902 [Diploscapter pachys]|uniref:Uncharacterized protein n=1 Tax=Diploscapter pachys TaxID=2018661 RepID=A0A2A2KYA1_9BILA|nr:hypothetical protein WR25_01902 [Diploscapter pachys]
MPRLKSIETCHRYWECLEEKHTHEQLCDKMKIKIEPRKGDAKQCLEAVREETTKLGRMAEAKRNLEVKCVQKSSLYNKTLNEQKIWTEHLLEQQPIDGRDAFCRSRFSLWIDEVRRKKESAVQYMKKCVNVVDITKECERSALYGVLADEYLIAKSELLDSLKACYFQGNNHLNKLL